MQSSGEDAAGSPSTAKRDRKRSLPRQRGGVKHRKASKAPPPPSSAPCPFGCGCWFREKCSFCHSDEDLAIWQQERAAKVALIDIAATRKKARLEGRSVHRSALSSLSNNNTYEAPKNTGVAHKEVKESCKGTGSAVVSALVHHPDCSDPTSQQMERAKRSNRQDVCCQVFAILGSATELPEPATVRACFLPAYFRSSPFATGPRSPPEHLKAHGTGWLQWKVTMKPLTAGRYLTLTQDGSHVKECDSCSLSLEDLMLDRVHLSFPQHWPEEIHRLVIDSDV